MKSPEEARWYPGVDIPLVFRDVALAVAEAQYVLITAIDSSRDVSSLPSLVSVLARVDEFHQDVGDGVVVGVGTAQSLMDEYEMFTGFDEVWLLDQVPESPKPADIRITSDRPLNGGLSVELESWMAGANCRVGLGDGDGLNVIASSPHVDSAISRFVD